MSADRGRQNLEKRDGKRHAREHSLHCQLRACAGFLGAWSPEAELEPWLPTCLLLWPQTVSFVSGKPVFAKYMDSFPFPFYIVLRDTGEWMEESWEPGTVCGAEQSYLTHACAMCTAQVFRSRHHKCSTCVANVTSVPSRLAAALPRTLADLLRQWFELSR